MKKRLILKGTLFFLAGGIFSLLLLGLVGYLINLSQPAETDLAGRLSTLDKIRLAETIHLRETLGEQVWPGWGEMDIPLLIWHTKDNFLFGIEDPPKDWELVSKDQFQAEPYYHNPIIKPENFIIRIGDQWAASMATKGRTDLFLQEMFQDVIPDFIEPIIPLRLLAMNSEIQSSGVLHETFHVFQARQAPDKFAAADASFKEMGPYWKVDERMHEAWQAEMDLLIEGVKAESPQAACELARKFLVKRENRRDDYDLSPNLISFEKNAEWLEGLAKYIELAIWETASQTPGYQPISEMSADPDFKFYQTFTKRWEQELNQAGRQASIPGDVRFYYSGMLQARLLDTCLPDWQSKVMADQIYLDDLLQEIVSP